MKTKKVERVIAYSAGGSLAGGLIGGIPGAVVGAIAAGGFGVVYKPKE
jgi:hypothetical protein